MINREYWLKIAEEWRRKDDGIEVPEVKTEGVADIEPDEIPFDSISDKEIADILSELGLDDI